MKTDIEQSVANCSFCQAQRQSNPRPKLDTVNLPGDAKQPMLHTACDLFSATGKQWLALVNRFSGYAWTIALRKLDTKAIIHHLEQWFNDFGWPTHIRTDGGPQFRSKFRVSRGLFCDALKGGKTSTMPLPLGEHKDVTDVTDGETHKENTRSSRKSAGGQGTKGTGRPRLGRGDRAGAGAGAGAHTNRGPVLQAGG